MHQQRVQQPTAQLELTALLLLLQHRQDRHCLAAEPFFCCYPWLLLAMQQLHH
jgi:hypothetical protein